MTDLRAPTLEDIDAARARIEPLALRTPLVRFEDRGGPLEILLKLENLQPIGSFKVRGALNRMLSLQRAALADGVYTASAGNMAQGVAYAARELGVAATVVVPEGAPAAKLDAVARLGGAVKRVPYDEWWETMRAHGHAAVRGTFIHPFADRDVMAGNGTIGRELLEDAHDLDAVLVPWGGGGLACGIAAAVRAIHPGARIYACEVEGAAPLHAALAARRPVSIENRRTFVDGIGGPGVFPEMWPMARELIAGSLTVTTSDVAEAVRLLAARARCVAEGAGATALAAARVHADALAPDARRVACIVSGGNIDQSVIAAILSGQTPD